MNPWVKYALEWLMFLVVWGGIISGALSLAYALYLLACGCA